jgi:hypothetical protein
MTLHYLLENGDSNMVTNSSLNGDIHCSISPVHIESLKKMIEVSLISPYIMGEKPISLLIIAKPESGKTTALKAYRKSRGIVYMTDCTAYGIQRDLLPKLVSGEIKTLMIADLLTPLSKSSKTRESFIAFLNNMIEEGIAKITSYAMVWDKEVNANIVTAVTDLAIQDGRHEWAKLGFLSRFVVFSYKYSLTAVVDILQQYTIHGINDNNTTLKLPKKCINIELPEIIADKLNPLAIKIGEQFGLYGIRAKINLRSVLKSLAFRNGRGTVSELDFNELLELAEYMNFDYNIIR